MATRSPTQTHAYWGVFPTASLPTSANVEVGDTAFDTTLGALVVCTAVGPVAWTAVGGGGGGGGVLWEWNGTDVTQFDLAPVSNTGAGTFALGSSPYNLSTNKAFSTIDLTANWTGGGAVAFRVTDPAFPGLPEQFRLRVGVSAVPFGIRIGVMFFDPTTWGSGLLGGGMTYGDTFLRWVIAKGAAAGPFAPFDLPGVTPGWADPSTVDNFNGMLNEWDCTLRPGAGSNPPAVALYGRSLGYVGGSNAYSITVDRGQLIGTGSIAGAVDPSFNGKSLTGLAIIAQSTAGVTVTASLNNLQILQY